MVGGSPRSPPGTACGTSRGRTASRSLPSGSSFLMARKAVGAVNRRHRLVLGDDAPEGAGVGRADRLALVEDRGRAVDQRPVDDVAVADHPAHVRGAPPDLAGIDAVEVLHRPGERHGIAAIVAHHALGLAGRARRIENVERIGRLHRHAAVRLGGRHRLVPVEIAAFHQRGLGLRPLEHQAARDLVPGELDRLVEQAACTAPPGPARCRTTPSAPAWASNRRCGWRARWRQSRRTPRNAPRPAARRPASPSPLRGSSACR